MESPEKVIKILTLKQWKQFEKDTVFKGSPVDLTDGYIHLSTPDQVSGVINRYYADCESVILVEIPLQNIAADIKWEQASNGEFYPHLYRELQLSEIKGHKEH